MSADIPHLQQLWVEAFGDSQETLDSFFTTGFSEDRFHCIKENNVPVSALYWFDCQLKGHKLAYLYAVATAKEHRGKGLAQRLMAQCHARLKELGYAGAILVPSDKTLFGFYEKMGYRTATTVTEFSCTWEDTPVALRELSPTEYANLRKTYLPPDSVLQEGATLAYLHTQAQFYAGEDFLLTATVQADTLLVPELLGNIQVAPHILRTLNTPKGAFRTVGTGRDFAMFLPLQPHCPHPGYFGLALD